MDSYFINTCKGGGHTFQSHFMQILFRRYINVICLHWFHFAKCMTCIIKVKERMMLKSWCRGYNIVRNLKQKWFCREKMRKKYVHVDNIFVTSTSYFRKVIKLTFLWLFLISFCHYSNKSPTALSSHKAGHMYSSSL